MQAKNITDDTRNLKKDSIFLITPQNEKFVNSLPHGTKTICRDELKKYFNTNIKIIGITGTNGKTTTSAAIYSALLDMGYKAALLGTRGMFANDKRIKDKGLTTPSVLELYADIDLACGAGCEFFIMEVSSHAIKQERIFGLKFWAKILTNITSDHLDYHKTWEDYAETKLSFMRAESENCVKIINLDDKCGASLRFLKNTFTYGVDSKGNLNVGAYSLKDGIFANLNFKINAKQVEIMESLGVDFKSLDSKCVDSKHLESKLDSKSVDSTQNIESCELNSSLFGLFNLYNLLAATLCLRVIINKTLSEICAALEGFGGVAGRMEIVSHKPLIIIDFAHTFDGMLQVFESFKNKKIAVVFGAGGDRDSSKRAKMGECAANFANKIYITNDNPRSENPQIIAEQILSGVRNSPHFSSLDSNNVKIILDRKEALRAAISDVVGQDSEWVLLILGKGDENTQIFADKTIPFSDKTCALEILKSL